MAEKNQDKKKRVKKRKKPDQRTKNKQPKKSRKSQEKKTPREDTVAGNGQIVQSKLAKLGIALAWAFVIFVGAGATIAIINATSSEEETEQVIEAGNDTENQQAGEYARGFVGAWLRATDEDASELERYMNIERRDITDEEPTEYRELAVASVETDDDGVSTVLISTEISTPVEEAEEQEVTEDEEDGESSEPASSEDEDPEYSWEPSWFQVNVYQSEGTFTTLGWPAPVSAPESGDSPRLGYRYDASEELAGTVESFFEAYALGEGDVNRLTHPDSNIQPLGGSLYNTVEVTRLTTDEDYRDEVPEDETVTKAHIYLNLGTDERSTRAATYALTLEARGGRWEVRNLDSSPVINPDEITVEAEENPEEELEEPEEDQP